MAIYKEVLEKNYTVTGSPTITDDFVASGFSSSSYARTSIPTLTQSFVHISKMFAPATVSTSGRYSASFSVNGSDTNWGLKTSSSNFLAACNILQAGTVVNTQNFSNTWVWVALEVTTTGAVMRTLQDPDGATYTLDTLPPLSDSAWNISITYNTNLLSTFSNKTLYLGVNNYHSNSTANWQIDLKNTKYIADGIEWRAVKITLEDVSGSVEISKGYYSDGSNSINMPASTYNIDALTANQTLGGKNKLFAYTDSTDSVGALITSTTPTGSFKITKDLEHPVYLDPTKNYIAGGELKQLEIAGSSYEGAGLGAVLPGAAGLTQIGDPTWEGSIVSNFTSSDYLTFDASFTNAPKEFYFYSKVYCPAIAESQGNYPDSFSVSGSNTCWGVAPNPSGEGFVPALYTNGTSPTTMSEMVFSNCWVWTCLRVTSSYTYMYCLIDPTGHTYNEESFREPYFYQDMTLCLRCTGDFTSVFGDKAIYVGVNNYQGNSTTNWKIDLRYTHIQFISAEYPKLTPDVYAWEDTEVTSIKNTKEALVYDENTDEVSWLPSIEEYRPIPRTEARINAVSLQPVVNLPKARFKTLPQPAAGIYGKAYEKEYFDSNGTSIGVGKTTKGLRMGLIDTNTIYVSGWDVMSSIIEGYPGTLAYSCGSQLSTIDITDWPTSDTTAYLPIYLTQDGFRIIRPSSESYEGIAVNTGWRLYYNTGTLRTCSEALSYSAIFALEKESNENSEYIYIPCVNLKENISLANQAYISICESNVAGSFPNASTDIDNIYPGCVVYYNHLENKLTLTSGDIIKHYTYIGEGHRY